MLVETEAVVLHTIKYSETSIVAHIYTKEFGNGSYIMHNVRTNRSKMAFFQPLSLVNITAYRKKDPQQLHRLSEISFVSNPPTLYDNIVKSTIALFIGEIVNRVFREEEQSVSFYEFLKIFVIELNEKEKDYANLHVLFLVLMTKYLGFFPKNNYGLKESYFSFVQAQFVERECNNETISKDESYLLSTMLKVNNVTEEVKLNQKERQTLLEIMLKYYDIHVCKMQNIKSFDVLKIVFS